MMIGLIFWVKARPGEKEGFVEFLQWDAQVAKESEPGTLRFEFYDDPNDANALYVYEAYQDEDAFAAHQANEPFQKWRSEMMPKAEDFKIIKGMGPCRGSMTD
jgi:autoinducer 2-degrading protein